MAFQYRTELNKKPVTNTQTAEQKARAASSLKANVASNKAKIAKNPSLADPIRSSNRTVDISTPTVSSGTPEWLGGGKTVSETQNLNLGTTAPTPRTTQLGTVTKPSVEKLTGSTFAVDPEAEKIIAKINLGIKPTTEEFEIAKNYLADKQVSMSMADPTAKYEQNVATIQREIDRQMKEEERARVARERELMAQNDIRVQEKQNQLSEQYAPEVDLAKQQGEQQKNDVKNVLAFQGFGRSTTAIQKVQEVNQSIDQRIRAIEAVKQAELSAYQAQLDGATREELKGYTDAIRSLRDKKNEITLEAAVKMEELRMEAMEKGNEIASKAIEKIQQTLLDDAMSPDMAQSKANGYLTTAEGMPIYNDSGNIIELPSKYDFGSVITDANGQNYIPLQDPTTGEFKMLPTGIRSKVSGSGGGSKDGKWVNVIDDSTGKEIQQRQLADGTMEYRALSGNKLVVKNSGKPYIPKRTSNRTTYKDPSSSPFTLNFGTPTVTPPTGDVE